MLHSLIREEGCCFSLEQRQTDSRVLGCVRAKKYVVLWHCQLSLGQGSVNPTLTSWAISCVALCWNQGGVGKNQHSHHSSPLLWPSLDTSGCLWLASWGHLRFSTLWHSSMPPSQQALANIKLHRLCSSTQPFSLKDSLLWRPLYWGLHYFFHQCY